MSASSEAAPRRPAGRVKRWGQNFALFCGVFGLCLGGTELGLRLAGFGRLEIYEPDSRLYWRLKPNQNCFTKIDRQPVRINSRGTRGPEFGVPKPADVFRILWLGDSRTFGWGLAEADTYPEQVRRLLQSHFSAAPQLEIINAGVNAWSYAQMRLFYEHTAAAWQPDLVVLGEANLWTQFSEQSTPEFAAQFMTRVRIKNFLRRFALYHYLVEVKLKAFYDQHRAKFVPVDPAHDQLFKDQQQQDPDAVFRRAMQGVCDVAKTNQARVVFLFIPELGDLTATNQSRVLRAKETVAATTGALVVDATPALRVTGGGAGLYFDADPIHLNARGNAILARTLAEALRPLLPTPAKSE